MQTSMSPMHNSGMRFLAAIAVCLTAGLATGAQPASVPELLQTVNALAANEAPVYAVDTRLRAAEALRALYPELRHQMIEEAWNTFRGIDSSQTEGIAARMFEAFYGYDPQQARSVFERKVAGLDETARLERAIALNEKLGTAAPSSIAALAPEIKSACAQAAAPELVRRCLDLHTEFAARLYRAGSAPPDDPSLRARFEIARLIEAADVASDFSALDLAGHNFSLASLRGKVVVLAFWATWCRPCHFELPVLEKISGRDRVVVLGIDQEPPAVAAPYFLDESGYTFPSLIDTGGRISRQYGVSAIPVCIIINREGRLVQRINGFQQGGEDDLQAAVDRAFK
jgi:peroxiredoxin